MSIRCKCRAALTSAAAIQPSWSGRYQSFAAGKLTGDEKATDFDESAPVESLRIDPRKLAGKAAFAGRATEATRLESASSAGRLSVDSHR